MSAYQWRQAPPPQHVRVECPCCEREAVVRMETYRKLCRMFSPEHEIELHKLVSRRV